MNQQFPDEFLSAFYDGELSPAEADSLRKYVEATPDARRELDDFKRISQLLGELPGEKLGPEFRAQVMQTAEREMLIPAAEATARRARSLKRLWPGLIALTASAAALVLGVWLVNRSNLNERGVRTSGSPVAATSGDASRAGTPAATAPSLAAKEGTRTAEIPAAPAGGGFLGGGKAGGIQQSFHAGQQLAHNKELVIKQELDGAKVGDVVEALEKSGDRVSVVHLTVVDRQEGLDKLRVLLSDNGIRDDNAIVLAPKDNSNDAKGKSAKAGVAPKVAKEAGAKASAPVGEQFICVVVEATTEQLTKALAELMEQEKFRELRYDATTVAVASLNDHLPPEARLEALASDMVQSKKAPAESSLQDAESLQRSSATTQNEKPKAAQQKVPAPPLARKSQTPVPQSPAGIQKNAPTQQAAPANQLAVARPSRQYQVALPANLLAPEATQELAKAAETDANQVAKDAAPVAANAAPTLPQSESAPRPADENRDGKADKTVDDAKPAEVAEKKDGRRSSQAAAQGQLRAKQSAQNASTPVQVLIIVEVKHES